MEFFLCYTVNMNYLSIDSDEQIIKLLEQWKINGTQQVAMDFEGEFNLHCYGEHLCLIQIFDGQNFYLIDPLSADELASEKNAKNLGKPFVPFANSSTRNNVTENGLRLLLESPQIEKIWFDCASDGELVWKKFGIRLTRVYDLFKLARVLGLVGPGLAGNLEALTRRFVEEKKLENQPASCTDGSAAGSGTNLNPKERISEKKRLQQTNWMLRPLTELQLKYALKDVANLFALRKELDAMVKEKKLLPQARAAMRGIPQLRKEAVAGYTKLPGYKRLKVHQQVYLRHFFEARDRVARQLNKPPYQVLDKHLLVRLSQKAPFIAGQLKAELGDKSRGARLLLPLMEEANLVAQKEVGAMEAVVP